IGEHARVTTSRLAHHLVVSLLNQRKQSEGQSLLESINQEEGLKPCLEDLDRRYNNSWFSTDWYSSAELTKSFGCFASLFDQWQALEGAREALAKIYFSAQPRLNKRLFDQDVETALLESWVLTLNWDMTLWNLLPRVAQWHGQCSDPCTMILPTEVHDTLEIIPVLAPKDLSWMSDDQKTFYEWCIRRVKALHAASCKAHDLIRQATTIWFIGCALNTYDCELNTAFSKAGVPCLSMVNVVNRWENASKTSARMKFLVSRRAGVNFRYIGT
ncbi:MAG: hypothetical protein KDK78_10750, partial [Chlamydiia bacterium]|nr:hypothetical protein [Chlamydiia bacterium]